MEARDFDTSEGITQGSWGKELSLVSGYGFWNPSHRCLFVTVLGPVCSVYVDAHHRPNVTNKKPGLPRPVTIACPGFINPGDSVNQ